MEFNKKLSRYSFGGYLHANIWRHIGYGPLVKEYGKQYGYRDGDNIVCWGHPKGDYLSEIVQVPPSIISKINNRKVILWTPHHIVDKNNPEHVSSWLEWKDILLNFFEQNQDLVLMIRPHPLLFNRLIKDKIMTSLELEKLKTKINESNNVILDLSDDYRMSFQVSNAIITDGTTFAIEYFYTKKPEALITKEPESFFKSEEFLKCIQVIRTKNDLLEFIKNIKTDNDLHKKERDRFIEKYIITPDTETIGKKIVNNIIKDIEADEKNPFTQYIIKRRPTLCNSN